MHEDAVAIIGVGCRFPGAVNDVQSLWNLLAEGREAVRDVPADRWNVERHYDVEPGIAGKSMAKRGGFLDHLDQFDPQFFGISPRETPHIDPQQRLMLETAWEAIEDAGLVLDFEKGTDIGVYVGISHNDYQAIQGTPWDASGVSSHSPTGSAHSIAANRISYCLNLKGPSIALDTACSSALTAVHAACEHIRAGRGSTALAGGVTVMITPGGFIGFSQAAMLSSEGRCKAFDAAADGFVRGEGAGMVLLKRLSDAVRDGDPIRGVILGTAVNQDGHTNGLSVPSPEAQTRLVEDACRDAGVDPQAVGFVEAHGTGTAVGDPIEAHALAEALCKDRPKDNPLIIGSIKTNLGHLETAAGIAGLLKAMLVVERGQIPLNLHFKEPNPNIDFEALRLKVPLEMEPFPQSAGPRLAGVNSFGFGGANAHVILREPPTVPDTDRPVVDVMRPWPLVVSARTEGSLRGNAVKLADWIEEQVKSDAEAALLPDLAYTLAARRNHHSYRLTLVARTPAEAAEELRAFGETGESPKVQTVFVPPREAAPRIAFVFSGQGPQWWGMGRELLRHEPVFRQVIEDCDAAMRPHARFSLLEELGREEADSQMHRTEIAQPAIFALQLGLTELWKSWGIEPAAIVGHSVGELAAACAAGILSLEEGARIIALRARFMAECARGEGTMLAIGLNETEALDLLKTADPSVSIAAFNGPRSVTLSGPKTALEPIAAELEGRNVFAHFVRVEHPFHSAFMEPAAKALQSALTDLQPRPESVPFFSTVSGTRQSGNECDAAYWGQGIRQPVLFAPAVSAVADFGVDEWLEISPHPALAISIQECLAERETKAPVRSSLRRENEHEALMETALALHRARITLDFPAMIPARTVLSLPAYAWDQSRWWHEANDWHEARLATGGRGLLDSRLPVAAPTWITHLDKRHMVFLKDHKVENHVIFPAAGFVELALEAGAQLFEGRPFVIEDFEIRRPLILPEPASAVQIEIEYDPEGRAFTIRSRQGTAWSTHVVGSLRDARTESEFAQRQRPRHGDLTPVDVEDFYTFMHDLGLRYGEEFRGVRQLAAGHGRADGRVTLGKESARRAEQYELHPALMDGALHVFSSAAATVEGRKSQMKLPVRFSRIHFLRSPGNACLVDAEVTNCNEELVEGDLHIHDGSGAACVKIEGFRAVSLASARKSGAPGGQRDVVYHLDWARTPSEAAPVPTVTLPFAQLHQAFEEGLDEVLSLHGRDRLGAVMVAQEHLAAVQIAKGLREMGVDGPFDADSLGVAEGMRPIFYRFVGALTERGLLKKRKAGWAPTKSLGKAAQSADAELRRYLEAHPGHTVEGLLSAATGAELGPILRGEKEAVQVLFGGFNADLLDHYYGDGLFSVPWISAIAAAVGAQARSLPEGRGLRILEVGGGTAGLAAHLLPSLDRGLHQYVFTDVSAGFFGPAAQKLANFPEVEFKVFDLEKPFADQDFEAGSFDIVVGTNCLHAAADIRAAVGNIEGLLAPGGTLLFMDTATPRLWPESIFGLTSGWWRFTDRDLRQDHPLLSRKQWEAVLADAGFDQTASVPGLIAPHGGETQIGLLARKPLAARSAAAMAPSQSLAGQSWMIFADRSGCGQALAARLQAAGALCRTVEMDDRFSGEANRIRLDPGSAEQWDQLFAGCAKNPPDRLVWMWTLDETEDRAPLLGTDILLNFIQALDRAMPTSKLRLDLVTRGAQPAGGIVALAQTPSIGLFRVILNEHRQFVCRAIDLDPAKTPDQVDQLLSELLGDDGEREVAFRGEARYVQRFQRGLPDCEHALDKSVPLRLQSRDRGILDSLRFTPFAPPPPGPGEVVIEVRAAGMNFRDVLKALGLYPAETIDASMFGDEVAGVVRAVGKGVKGLAVGDDVFGIAVFGLATHALARVSGVRKMPAGLSYEEAATLPVVFMTAWYALADVARIRKGEKILIHAGAGGVGMAATQIALHLGAEVFATAGSPEKRALLKTLGVHHVIDSRKADFAEQVMQLTGRKGVDVVLNSLAGEAIPMGLSCLGEFGRFIEIGKRDIYQNSRIPLWPLRHNVSFHVVAMAGVFNGDAKFASDILGTIAKLVKRKALHPLPFRAFPACRIDAAFRFMAQGKHLGKIIVSFAEPFVVRRGKQLVPDFAVRPDASYLITGAFGGFGKVIARWLVACGAKNLVLTSRSGASTPEAAAFVEELDGQGVSTKVLKADIGSATDVEKLIAETQGSEKPLAGIFHLAMVIDDAPLGTLNAERMRAVLNPKARGAWLLHEATKNEHLDCFVMFSSVSSVFGNPAQGNYAAANSFLDALAHHRQALGLPALTINWGVLGGEGYVARNERVAEFLANQGMAAISPGEVVSLMESFLNAGDPQIAAMRVDWGKWRQSSRGLGENPLFERILSGSMEDGRANGAGENWRAKLDAAAPEDRLDIIGQAVRTIIGGVLRVKPDGLRIDQPLTDLGLDSLMGAEIETAIDASLGVGLPPTSLMRARTIGHIATIIDEHLSGAGGTPVQAPQTETRPASTPDLVEDVDFDSLSDEDLDDLLDENQTESAKLVAKT